MSSSSTRKRRSSQKDSDFSYTDNGDFDTEYKCVSITRMTAPESGEENFESDDLEEYSKEQQLVEVGSTNWACSACTLVNEASAIKCEICGNSAPKLSRTTRSTQSSIFGSDGSQRSQKKAGSVKKKVGKSAKR